MSMSTQNTAPSCVSVPPFSSPENVAVAEEAGADESKEEEKGVRTVPGHMGSAPTTTDVQCTQSTPLLLPSTLAVASTPPTTSHTLDAMRQEPAGVSSPTGCGGGGAAALATDEDEDIQHFNTRYALAAKFYPQQIDACSKIINNFLDGTTTYVMLLAQMQSGKSDCFMLAAAELLRLGKIDKFVVMCGNPEIALCKQAKEQGEFWDKYQRYLIVLGGGWNEENVTKAMKQRRAMEKDMFEVVFGAQLNTYTSYPTKRTLFIWDESHYAQSQGNRPDKFFQKNGLNATGEPILGGNLMLSVSATPFSEIIVNCKKQNKKVVVMTPGDTYIGVASMFENKQIIGYNLRNIDDVIRQRVREVEAAQKRNETRCWGLIRCDAKSEAIVRKHYSGDIIVLDASIKTDINCYLEGKTMYKNGGIILLRKSGKVKMGKQLTSKDRILWVMETAKQPNTDTLLQGLLGRCMGYPKSSGANTEIKIYISDKVLDCGNDGCNDLQRYVVLFNEIAATPECIPETVPPTRAMNVISKCNSRIMRDPDTGNPIFHVVTDRIVIDLSVYDNATEVYNNTDVYNALADIVDKGMYQTTNDTSRLRKLLGLDEHSPVPSAITISALDEHHNKKYEDHHTDLNNSFVEQKVHRVAGASLGCRYNEIKLWCRNCKSAGGKIRFDNPRESIIECFIEYRSDVAHPSDTEARLEVDTSLREVFSHSGPLDEDGYQETIVSNGAHAARLVVETSHDVNAMKTAIRNSIQNSLNQPCEAVHFPRKIEASATNDYRGWKGITVTKEVEDAIKKGGVIYDELNKEFGVEIKTVKMKGRIPTTFAASPFSARYSMIKW